jgi:hypothetical protein
MKLILQSISLCVLLVTLGSCKKEETKTTNSNHTEFFEITIDGQTFKETFTFLNLSGFESTTCDNKPGFLNTIHDPDLNSRFSINTDISHYKNEIDFDTKGVGNYVLNGGPNPFGLCHLTFYLQLSDKSHSNENTTLQPGGVHTLTSIETISTSSGKKDVLLEGTFSGVYKNSSNSNISVSGRYKKIVEVLK